MKAQVSMEFLVVFLLGIAFLSFLLAVLLPLQSKTDEMAADIHAAVVGEEMVCTAETVLNSGSVFSYESEVKHWLEEGRLVLEVNGKIHVIGGTFHAEKEGEPV